MTQRVGTQKIQINNFNIIYEALDFIKNKMSGLLTPDVEENIIGSAEILEIFKVSKDIYQSIILKVYFSPLIKIAGFHLQEKFYFHYSNQ